MGRFKPIAQCRQMGVASEYVVLTLVTNPSRTFQQNLRTVFPHPAEKFAWRDVPKILHIQLRKMQVSSACGDGTTCVRHPARPVSSWMEKTQEEFIPV
eukprot:s1596_g11.t1